VFAEIHFVRVHREDLFLRQAMLEQHRDECFRNFAFQRPFAR
jgi:hypothetical protein